jgi:uncharacterized protein YacL
LWSKEKLGVGNMKDRIFKAIVSVIVVILIFLIADMYWTIRDLIEKNITTGVPYIKSTLYGMFIGILVEWYSLRSILQGNFKLNWLFAPTLVILILVFIPEYYWYNWFGLGGPWFVEPFKYRESQIALDIIAGILFIRSLTIKR